MASKYLKILDCCQKHSDTFALKFISFAFGWKFEEENLSEKFSAETEFHKIDP
jgi:hypothetical protein